MALEKVVIVGAGQGGYQVAASLRQDGFAGQIVLVGEEPGLPYQRPPLSKAYLQGDIGVDKLRLRNEGWFADQRVTLRHGRVTAIARERRQVRLADAAVLDYDHLVLAPGARNRPLPLAGADLPNVRGIRTLADADALGPLLATARRAVVVGAGFIGLEFAAVAARRGLDVDVVELADRPMARAVSQAMSNHARTVHEAWGVRFRCNAGVQRLEVADDRVVGLHASDGARLRADLVVVGIGVLPDTALALQAGLAVDNGICVDELLCTADPAISAIGDAVSFPCVHAGGRRLRLESVQNAVDQARAVAARLMGRPAPYRALPWFWSDQGGMKLQIAGLAQGHDRVVDLACEQPNQKTTLCFRAGRLLAVETANRPGDHMLARKLLGRDCRLTPEAAAAPGFNLKEYEIGSR